MYTLTWDQGSAYDFFISLYVLHKPADFGLRPSWAAGVRSRLPVAQREMLEKSQAFLQAPLPFLHRLTAPTKNADAVISYLASLAPSERLAAITYQPDRSPEALEALQQIARDGSYNLDQLEVVRNTYSRRGVALRTNVLHDLCTAWADLDAFGTQYLEALKIYQQVFFAEEETRITSVLDSGLDEARRLAERLPVPELLAELSRGVHFAALPDVPQLILVPSYWSTPLVFYRQVSDQSLLMLFGCRPPHQTLVPGEIVPDGLVASLRALDDPTRLRIMRYLAEEPSTPSELSRRLRLRPPTVVHHLSTLRLAGLVEVTVQAEGERRYALRSAALLASLSDFKEFIFQGKKLNE